MNIEDIAYKAGQEAKLQVLRYDDKYFHREKTYHTFADKTIIPTFLDAKVSRREVRTLQTFPTINGALAEVFPAFGASMSYMRSTFAKALFVDGRGIHILPRVDLSEDDRLVDIIKSEVPVGVSLGVSDSIEFIEHVVRLPNVQFLSIDIAHGASAYSLDVLSKLSALGVNKGVVVGNVGSLVGFLFTYNAMKAMGFDHPIIKVGVGPGSVCTTRVNTGVGLGQLGLLEEIWDYHDYVLEDENLRIISDGGVNTSGDFAKALARSHGVMMGKYFVSDSFEPEVFTPDGIRLYGMASAHVTTKTGFVEGGMQLVEDKHLTTAEVVASLHDGLRSAMTYVGARDLRQFRQKTMFGVNSPGAYKEGGIH